MFEDLAAGTISTGIDLGRSVASGQYDEDLVKALVQRLGVSDAAAVQLISQFVTPKLGELRERAVNWATGTSDLAITASDLMRGDPLAVAIQKTSDNYRLATGVDPYLGEEEAGQREMMAQKMLVAMGYTPEEAAQNTGGLRGEILRGVAGITTSKITSNAQNISRELLLREEALSNEGKKVTTDNIGQTSAISQAEIFNRAVSSNRFNGISQQDIGTLATHVIRSGKADYAKNSTDRSARIMDRAEGMSEGIANLRSVVGSDVSADELVSRLNKIYGSNVLNMDSASFRNMTSDIKKLAINTGMDPNRLADVAARGYSSVSVYGGDSRLGTRVGMTTQVLTGSGPMNTPGLSEDEYRQDVSNMVSYHAAQGDTRNVAAAYNAFLTATGEKDNDLAWQKFQEKTKDMNLANSEESAKFIGDTLGLSDEGDISQAFHTYSNAESTRTLESNRGDIMKSVVGKEIEEERKQFTENVEQMLDDSGTSIKEVFGSEEAMYQMSPEEIEQTILRSDKLDKAERVEVAGQISSELDASTGRLGATNRETAYELMSRGKKQMKVADRELAKVEGNYGSTTDSLARRIMEAKNGRSPSISELTTIALTGVDKRDLETLDYETRRKMQKEFEQDYPEAAKAILNNDTAMPEDMSNSLISRQDMDEDILAQDNSYKSEDSDSFLDSYTKTVAGHFKYTHRGDFEQENSQAMTESRKASPEISSMLPERETPMGASGGSAANIDWSKSLNDFKQLMVRLLSAVQDLA